MRPPRDIPERAYELAIVGSTLIWGGSYVVLKGALDSVGPGWLLGTRFLLAGLLMAALLSRRLARRLDRDHLVAGVLIGIPGGLGFLAQNVGLTLTTPGRNAFLTATYCVMVPFVSWAAERVRPRAAHLVATALCLAGLALLSRSGDASPLGGLGVGDALTLVGAAFFALNVVAIGICGRGRDPVTLTVVQLLVCGAVCLAWGVMTEDAPAAGALTPRLAAQMAYLVCLSTIVTTLAQNVAQQHVDATRAALLFSLESVFGAVLSVALLGERLTLPLLAGFALIFSAILVSELGEGAGRD